MRIKKNVITLCIIFILSFILEGINDPNTFRISEWRLNNIVNILNLWFIFSTTYYLFAFIVQLGHKKLTINTSNKLIGLLLITQLITFTWVIFLDILFLILYYNIESLSETTFYEFDIPLAIVILTIGSVYFYQKNYLKSITTETSKKNTLPQFKKHLEVFKGAKNIFINHMDIGIVHLSDKIVWITTLDHETFQTSATLSELSDQLSSSHFFRLNRQVIVSRKIVKGYNKLNYQKLEALIDDHLPSNLNLIVSKYNSPNFKKWLTNSL